MLTNPNSVVKVNMLDSIHMIWLARWSLVSVHSYIVYSDGFRPAVETWSRPSYPANPTSPSHRIIVLYPKGVCRYWYTSNMFFFSYIFSQITLHTTNCHGRGRFFLSFLSLGRNISLVWKEGKVQKGVKRRKGVEQEKEHPTSPWPRTPPLLPIPIMASSA